MKSIITIIEVYYRLTIPRPILQVEVMRGNTKSHVKKFASQLSKFTARWNQLRPKTVDLEGDATVGKIQGGPKKTSDCVPRFNNCPCD